MQFPRPRGLRAPIYKVPAALFVLLATIPLFGQQQPAPQQPKPPNPFEQVPQAEEPAAPRPEPPKPQAAKPATPGPAAPSATADRPPTDTIESINFQGARKVPQDTLRAMIFSKRGDMFDAESLHRDLIT